MPVMATLKQTSFLTVLIPERVVPEDGPFASIIDEWKNGVQTPLTKSEAGEVISYLMDLPKSDKATRASIRIGVYQLPGVGTVKVRQVSDAKDKFTQLLDMRTRRYVDAPALMAALEPQMRMKAKETAVWTRSAGICPWCADAVEHAANPLQVLGTRCARKLI